MVGQLKDAELESYAPLFENSSSNLFFETARLLRSDSNQPPAIVLRPVIERHWDSYFKPALENGLRTWLVKVEPPKTPEGALERAQFVLKNAQGPGDFEEGAKLLQVAAEGGNGKAQLLLGTIYLEGQGVNQDVQQGLKWLTRSAEQSEPHAACSLGDIYMNGRGVSQDFEAAGMWYHRDATNGCSRAQFMYALGLEKGSPKDAMLWYRTAATNGFAAAQTALGDRLTEGLLWPVDKVEAYLWYFLAAENGDRVAAASTRRLKSKLSPEEAEACEKEGLRIEKLYRSVQQEH